MTTSLVSNDALSQLKQNVKEDQASSAAVTSSSNNSKDASHGADSSGAAQLQLQVAGRSLALLPGLTYILGSDASSHVQFLGEGVEARHASIKDHVLQVLHATPSLAAPAGSAGASSVARPTTKLNGREVLEGMKPLLRQGDIILLGTHAIEVQAVAPLRHENRHAIAGAATSSNATNALVGATPEKERDSIIRHVQAAQHQDVHPPTQQRKSSGNGAVYGQKFNDNDLNKFPDQQQTQQTTQTQPQTLQQEKQHAILEQEHSGQEKQLVRELQTQMRLSEQHGGSGGLPVAVVAVPIVAKHDEAAQQQQQHSGGGLLGAAPIAVVDKDAPVTGQQQPQQHHAPVGATGATSGPALARLGVHKHPGNEQHHHQAPVVAPTASSSSIAGGPSPAFSTPELVAILSDMLDLSGGRLTPGARRLLPHWIDMLPSHSHSHSDSASAQRQSMGSQHIKEWIHRATEERSARLNSATTPSATLAATSTTTTTQMTNAGPVSAATVAGSLCSSPPSSDPHEFVESDLALALLALQASESTMSSSASQIQPTTASSGESGAGSSLTDSALLTLLGDFSEMGGWKLAGGWESAVRYMIDEKHCGASRRACIDSNAIKQWIRAAAADGDKTKQLDTAATTSMHTSGTTQPAGSITSMQLLHGLIASNN